jgi:anti-anti-sigma factor
MAVSGPAGADIADDSHFQVHSERRGLVRTITVKGEMDLASVGRFNEVLCGEADGAPQIVLVDLSGVELIDSSGVSALVQADQRLRERHSRLVILPAPPLVQRTFDVAGVSEMLAFAQEPSALDGHAGDGQAAAASATEARLHSRGGGAA